MRLNKTLQNVLIGATAVVIAGARLVPGSEKNGPVTRAAIAIATGTSARTDSAAPAKATSNLTGQIQSALDAFSGVVGPLSDPQALEDAFHSYYAFKAEHPDEVKKPYLYFVDYGLPSTEKRGYVFDMDTHQIVEGPFTVAHGRGSSTSRYGVPTHFANASGSNATSLGLYVAKALYDFTGHTGGRAYHSTGMRLDGVSQGFNDEAYARKVVAHGAPYVTPTKAGRSEGCPAMEPDRAARLLPKLADGGLVFLFAPDANWLHHDQWVTAAE